MQGSKRIFARIAFFLNQGKQSMFFYGSVYVFAKKTDSRYQSRISRDFWKLRLFQNNLKFKVSNFTLYVNSLSALNLQVKYSNIGFENIDEKCFESIRSGSRLLLGIDKLQNWTTTMGSRNSAFRHHFQFQHINLTVKYF